MNIIEVNVGQKIEYEVHNNKITFGDDELTLNLSKYERDDEVVIHVCIDHASPRACLKTLSRISLSPLANTRTRSILSPLRSVWTALRCSCGRW